jgi:hypothetical protein
MFFVICGGVVYITPDRPGPAALASSQSDIDAIRALLREAQNMDVAPTGPWDDHVEARFAGFVKWLQGEEHWGNPTGRARDPKTGWPHPADGIWSRSYSRHLGTTIAARPFDQKTPAVRELKAAADALVKSSVLRTTEEYEVMAIALAPWSGFLSGWAEEIVIHLRFGKSPQLAQQARREYARAIAIGRDAAPYATAVLSILGAAFSLLTVVGYAILVPLGPSSGAVFKLAFGIELVEGLAYLMGQRSILGYWSDGWYQELGLAVVAGFVLGGIEKRAWERRHPGRS